MAVLQLTKSSGADTFGEFLQKYFNIFSSPLFSSNCLQVLMVFYQYWATSQKESKSEVLPLQYQDNGEVSCKSKKKKVWLELFSSACFISPIGF